jgi:hypothetical protein
MSETPADDLTVQNWWETVQGRKEGGAKLLKRCIELLSWRADFAMNVLHAYREFLECKVSVGDFDGTQLEPSLPVYQMWSQHILDTKGYAKDCTLLFGRVLHHDPDLFRDYHGRPERINKTMQLIYEKNKGNYLDPVVWHFGPIMGGMPQQHGSTEHGAIMVEGDASSGSGNPQAKRARVDNINGPPSYQIEYQHAPPSLNQKFYTKVPIPSKIAKEKSAGVVSLQIFKGTDGGAMDNKVTLNRDQQLRTVLDYFRYRCIWQHRRLNLHCTPNELKMGSVENIILSSIHVDESITLWFRDYKGATVARVLRMRETIGSVIADHVKELGVDQSKLVFSHRGSVLSPSSTPLYFQLDHGDVVDIALAKNEEEATAGIPSGGKEIEEVDNA